MDEHYFSPELSNNRAHAFGKPNHGFFCCVGKIPVKLLFKTTRQLLRKLHVSNNASPIRKFSGSV